MVLDQYLGSPLYLENRKSHRLGGGRLGQVSISGSRARHIGVEVVTASSTVAATVEVTE